MEITWYGHSCFRITERMMATVVADPYNHEEVGYGPLTLKGDIVTMSQDEAGYNYDEAVKGAEWKITGAGEYEIGGVFLTAVPTEKSKKNGGGNMVYTFDYNGVNVVHLGRMNSAPSRAEVEAFGTVDVLLVPVGGGGGLNAAKAAEVISMLEPGIVIPMHYQTENAKGDLNSIDQFLKEMGLGKEVEARASLKIAKNNIPEETRVELLAPKQ
ncbi:MAG: MBL fold metallo-hydrolase [Deltaproteobacteria bacterium]